MSYTKPPYGATVDATNPITNGLVLAALLNEASGATVHNAVDSSTATLGSGWAWGTGASGCPAIIGGGTQDATYFTPSAEVLGDLTVLAIGQNNADSGLGGATGAFFQQGVTTPQTTGSPLWSVRLVNSYAGIETPPVSGAQLTSYDAGTGRVMLLATFDVAAQILTEYAGGTQVASVASGAPSGTQLSTSSTKRWYLGQTDGNPAGYHSLNGSLELVLLWNRKLSGAEISAVMTDPYALFTTDSPTGFSVTPGPYSNTLGWTAYAGATGYNIYRGMASGTETLLTTVGAVTSYVDQCLTAGTDYYYRISAIVPCGETGQSVERRGTPTALAAPTGLMVTAGDKSLTVAWDAVLGATSYAIARAAAHGGPYATLATGVTATIYTDTGLAPGTAYYYIVTASNACGTGSASAEASGSPLCCDGEYAAEEQPASAYTAGEQPATAFTGAQCP